MGKKAFPILTPEDPVSTVQSWLSANRSFERRQRVNKGGRTILSHAARYGNVAAVELLLTHGDFDVNHKDNLGRTPLHLASTSGWLEVVGLLLAQSDIQVDIRDKEWKTPLWMAAEKGEVAVVRRLLSHGFVSVNDQGPKGYAPLHLAAKNQNADMAELLLSYDDLNPNMGTEFDITPLNLAAEYGSLEVVKLLLSRADIDVNAVDLYGNTALLSATKASTEFDITPLNLAAEYGSLEVIKLLLSRADIDVNAVDVYGNTALLSATKASTEIVRLLLSREDTDPNIANGLGEAPLLSAVANGNMERVQLLLSHPRIDHAVKDQKGLATLSHAVIEGGKTLLLLPKKEKEGSNDNGEASFFSAVPGGVDMVELLLSHGGIDLEAKDDKGLTALSLSVMAGGKAIVEILLSHGLDANTRDKKQQTPLILAVQRGNRHVVSELLAHGVDLEAQDESGRTATSFAAERDSDDILSMLLSMDADPNKADDNARTPLSWATRHIATCSKLLSRNIDIDYEDDEGRTPLSRAAEAGEREVLLALLSYGADPDITDNDGLTALIRASMAGMGEIMLILILFGANMLIEADEGKTVVSCASSPWAKALMEVIFPDSILRAPVNYTDWDGILLSKDTGIESDLFSNSEYPAKDTVNVLLVHDFRDRENRTLLSRVAGIGHKKLVKEILPKVKQPLDVKDQRGRSALHWAAEKGSVQVVDMLLKTGRFDPNAKDDQGRTPMALAIGNYDQATVRCLASSDSVTLHSLVEQENKIGVDVLFSAGYDGNQQDKQGQTPLHVAIMNNNTEMAVKLILWKVDVDIADMENRTPLQLAISQKNRSLVSLLLRHSANSCKRIMAREWLEAFRRPEHDIIQLSDGGKKLDFLSNFEPRCEIPLAKLAHPGKRMLIISDYPSWKQYLTLSPPSVQNFLCNEKPSGKGTMTYIIFKVPRKQVKIGVSDHFTVEWDECGLAWSMMPFANAKGQSRWAPTDHISMLPYGWIPEDSLDFLRLSIMHLKEAWLRLCDQAEKHQTQRRLDQLSQKGGHGTLINSLAADAAQWTLLRSILQDQATGAKSFAVDHSRRYSNENGSLKSLEHEIDLFIDEISQKFNGLDQTVRDLLQLEFAWVSINELHGMRRITWITFLFLPLMFASSLFGMNVNLLKSNPDWRWFLLVGGTFIILTIVAWLVLKYSPVESWLGKLLDRSLFRSHKPMQPLPWQHLDQTNLVLENSRQKTVKEMLPTIKMATSG